MRLWRRLDAAHAARLLALTLGFGITDRAAQAGTGEPSQSAPPAAGASAAEEELESNAEEPSDTDVPNAKESDQKSPVGPTEPVVPPTSSPPTRAPDVAQPAALPSGADKSGVTSKTISVPSGSGTVQGMGESFSAQLSTGIATFSVPIALPAARGGAQPSLGLSYSSSGGYGVAGVGWQIGVPFIARQTDRGVPRYKDQSIWHPEQDHFVFNGGQELVPICTVSGSTCAGALENEAMPVWADGWQYFRPRVEGSFLRFFWAPNHLTWRVQDKSGVTMELGVPLDGSNYTNALERNPDKISEIYRWHLVRQYDTYGDANPATGNPTPNNVVTYRYFQDGGSAYLSDIYDTPPASSPSTAPLSQWAHHTRLAYEVRSDPTTSYRTGWKVEQRLRLARLDVASKTEGAFATDARKLIRRYHLTYAQAWHGALLESVQVEGRCGSRENDSSVPAEDGNEGFPASTGCARLPAMKLGYSHVTPYAASGAPGVADLPGFEGFDERVIGMKSSPPHSVDEELSDLFDVDADGLPDLLVTAAGVYGPAHGVFFNGAAGESNSFGSVVKMSVGGVLGADANTISLKNLNVAALDLDGDGISDLLHMPKVKTYAVYGAVRTGSDWSWQGRAVDTADGLSAKIDLGKDALDTQIVDVDFDGLVDVVVTTGTEVQTYFSLGRYPGGDGRFGQATPTGATTATLSAEPVRTCVPWSGTPVRFSDPDIKLSDMNGDGIADIVRVRQGEIIYWPGRGNGLWGSGKRDNCPAGTFGANRHVTMTKAPFYSDIQGQGLRLDDVNGDGLADLVEIRFGELDVWLNTDGQGWTERHIIKGTPQSPGFMNRVRLVDVNGSGTRDVLWGTAGNYQYIDLAGGARPSVLTKVENGLGKTTTLSYSTSTAEMLAASKAGKPWNSRMPTVAHVVKTVVETNNLSLAGVGVKQRVTEYSYADPVYEGRQREFRGFRKASAKRLGDPNSPTDITETTFLLGECADEKPSDGIAACAISERWRDNPREAMKGLPQITEKRDESGVYLSTELNVYKLRRLYTGLDGREVRQAFEYEKYSALYDTSSFTPALSTSYPVGLIVEPNLPGVSDLQETAALTYRASSPVVIASRSVVDLFGNRTDAIAYGCTQNCPSSSADETITTHTAATRPDNDPTGWLWRTGSSYVEGSAYFLGQLNQTVSTYSVRGAPLTTTLTLGSTLALDRFHETQGASVAPAPTGASSNGSITAATNTYDDFGNLTSEAGASSRCRDVTYDDVYKQLATSEKIYTNGCDGSWLATAASYDRGLAQVSLVLDMNSKATYVAYDSLGRLSTIRRPRPDGQSAENTTPSIKLTYYLPTDLGTPSAPAYYSIVKTETQDASSVDTASYLESWSYVDGFGQTLLTIAEADTNAGDTAAWIASDRVVFDAKGAVEKTYLDSFFSGPAGSFDLQASTNQPAGSQSYDAFGRQKLTRDIDGTVTLESFYHALSTDLWDAADREDTAHLQTYATERKDGHGRTALSIERFKESSTIKERETTTVYLPTGQPQKITRKLAGASSQVVRWMRYDSLGRMVLNVEPNASTGYTDDPTSLPSTLKAWRYAYNDAGDLVGTSDARGCGVNFEYDAAGRLLLEDYSPCEAAHAVYSTPNLTNRTGIEVQYHYDSAPSDAPSGFFTSACLNTGRLVAVYDRASASMSCHDPRGRVSASAVRVAKPGAPDEDLDNRYAPRWYYRDFVFDSADRELAATTGATHTNLQGTTTESQTGSTSAVSTHYSGRGTVKSAGGSYGTLLASITRHADGLISTIVRGDLADTTTTYSYDERRRIERILTDRGPPSEWSSPPSNYLPAPSYPSNHQPTYQLILQDDNFTYDIVGNPTTITDSRVADEWPAGAKPVTRDAVYDDLYRLVSIQYQFAATDDTWVSPFDAENSGTPSLQDPRRAKPSPHISFDKRLLEQTFSYDWLGNTSSTDDDAHGFYDRSLGTITNGPLTGSNPKPYQLASADNTGTSSSRSGTLETTYDAAGNLKRLQVDRNGPCLPSGADCNQVFGYEWDEVGRLSRAKRWDVATLPAITDPLPSAIPDAHLKYAYDAGDQRVLKTAIDENETERHTVYVFETLELRRAAWITTGTPDYDLTEWTETVYLYSHGVRLARLGWDESDVPTYSGGQLHVLLEAGDHLGSTTVVIDLATGELVERGTYQAYGGSESDYRPGRWKGFREDYGFTGKEEDVEVGLQYFGKRYLAPLLNRWVSADPLAVQQPGRADANVYAYVSGQALKAVDPLGLDPPTGDASEVVTYIDITNPSERDFEAAKLLTEGEATLTFEADWVFARAGVKPADGSFRDAQVQQMGHAAFDSAVEVPEGTLRLAGAVGVPLTSDLADQLGSVKYGAPADPVLKLSYDEHKFGSGLLYTGLLAVAPIGGSARAAETAGNDLQWSALTFGDKIRYEVGQVTLRDSTYKDLASGGLAKGGALEDVAAVVDRGRFMTQMWGWSTVARLNPLKLINTASTGGTPSARAAGKVAVPAAKAAAGAGRASMEQDE